MRSNVNAAKINKTQLQYQKCLRQYSDIHLNSDSALKIGIASGHCVLLLLLEI